MKQIALIALLYFASCNTADHSTYYTFGYNYETNLIVAKSGGYMIVATKTSGEDEITFLYNYNLSNKEQITKHFRTFEKNFIPPLSVKPAIK